MVNHHKMINAAIATLATCAMLLPVAGANANEPSNTAVLGAGYTATKISRRVRPSVARTIHGLRSVMATGCMWALAIPQWVPH